MKRLVHLIRGRYPTYLIGIPGLVALVAGLALGVAITIRVFNVHVVPVGTTVISVSLCMAGAMCLLGRTVLTTVGKLEQEIQSKTANPAENSTPSTALPGSKDANRALLVFGLVGLAALLAGLSWGAWAVYATFTWDNLFPGSYIGSASACLAGLMMILAGTTRHELHKVLQEVQGPS